MAGLIRQYEQAAGTVAPPAVTAPVVQAPEVAVRAPTVVTPGVAAPQNSRQAANAYNAAVQDQAAATDAMGRAQAQDAADQADLMASQNAMEAGLAEQEEQRVRARQEVVDQLAAEHREKAEEASRVQIADRRSSGQKVLGILGVALAGLGDAISTKQTDYARRVSDGIDQAIERDLQLQREALAGKRADVAAKYTELGIARGFLQDEKQQIDWAKAKRQEMWAARLEETGMRSKSAVVQAASAEKVAALRAQAAETQTRIFQDREQAAASNALGRANLQQRRDEFAISSALEQERAQLAAESKRGAAGDKPLTDGQRKQDAVVAGAADAYSRLQQAVASGGVNAGATAGAVFGSGNWVPSALTGEKTLQERADVTNVVRSILRVESGSNVPESEVEGKIKALGLDSGDDEVRARGMRQLLSGFQALDVTGRLAQPAAATPPAPDTLTYLLNPATGETKGFPARLVPKAQSMGWKAP